MRLGDSRLRGRPHLAMPMFHVQLICNAAAFAGKLASPPKGRRAEGGGGAVTRGSQILPGIVLGNSFTSGQGEGDEKSAGGAHLSQGLSADACRGREHTMMMSSPASWRVGVRVELRGTRGTASTRVPASAIFFFGTCVSCEACSTRCRRVALICGVWPSH